MFSELPDHVTALLNSAMFTQYATVSSAGVPIDTPLLCFQPDDLGTIDVCTGLAYPAKADRARRNPKVGLLIEGGPNEPVISIAGIAAVRDANLQANAERYIAETSWAMMEVGWENLRKGVHYWPRIFITVTPQRILWWDTPAAMDGTPNRLEAPAGLVFPQSDPAPAGKVSETPKWPQRPWSDQARDAVAARMPGHLTLCDDEGFALPIQATRVEVTADGFRLGLPKWTPWRRSGKATLTFEGKANFVGDVNEVDGGVIFIVQRTLPVLPMLEEQSLTWEPTPFIRDTLMGRLRREAERRGQPVPTIPEVALPPTASAQRRIARMTRLMGGGGG